MMSLHIRLRAGGGQKLRAGDKCSGIWASCARMMTGGHRLWAVARRRDSRAGHLRLTAGGRGTISPYVLARCPPTHSHSVRTVRTPSLLRAIRSVTLCHYQRALRRVCRARQRVSAEQRQKVPSAWPRPMGSTQSHLPVLQAQNLASSSRRQQTTRPPINAHYIKIPPFLFHRRRASVSEGREQSGRGRQNTIGRHQGPSPAQSGDATRCTPDPISPRPSPEHVSTARPPRLVCLAPARGVSRLACR